MTFEEWLENNRPKRESTSPDEIRQLLGLIDRDLPRSKTDPNIDYRLFAVHNAALSIAQAALRARDFRLQKGPGHHKIMIDSLMLTIGAERDDIATLHAIRNKRNVAEYGAPDMTSEDEVEEARNIVARLHHRLLEWIRQYHPELL